MPIVRQDPVKNMDTDSPLIMRMPNQRFTRSSAHRILKAEGVKHDPSAPMETLIYLIQANNLQFVPPPPGPIRKPVKLATDEFKEELKQAEKIEKLVKFASDGWPLLVPILRRMCKDKKIRWSMNDKRPALVMKLENHKRTNNGKDPS